MNSTILKKRWLSIILVFSELLACDTIDKPIEPIAVCGAPLTNGYMLKYRDIMEAMHRDMESVPVAADDKINFLRQMIPHHQGAIEMSELILQNTTDRRIVNMAQGIITDQRNEIAIMKFLIAQLESDSILNKP